MKNSILLFAVLALLATKTQAQTVTDIDGNVYNTVTIGTQQWMTENLKVSHYNNGDPIPNVTDNNTWVALTTGAFCFYENTPSYNDTYGKFYNWFTVVDSRNLCPAGWSIPSNVEWTILSDYLTQNGYGFGGSGADIGKSMAATSGWNSSANAGEVGNDPASNNSTGFSGKPGATRAGSGNFYALGKDAGWWSATPSVSTTNAWYRALLHNYNGLSSGSSGKDRGYNVRCQITNTTGIQDLKPVDKIQIYPNPAFDRVTVNLKEAGNAKVHIYDVAGKCVLESSLNTGKNEIDVSSISKGIYMVKISGNDWTEQQKLIKE